MRYLIYDDQVRQRCLDIIAQLPTKPPYQVTVEKYRRKRTNEQNRMMWTYIRAIAQGDCVEVTKDRLLMKYAGYDVRRLPDGTEYPVPQKGTSSMSVDEINDFINWLQMFCAEWNVEVTQP